MVCRLYIMCLADFSRGEQETILPKAIPANTMHDLKFHPRHQNQLPLPQNSLPRPWESGSELPGHVLKEFGAAKRQRAWQNKIWLGVDCGYL
jgi:hypothetical protein